MKVLHVNFSDTVGGAARAVQRIKLACDSVGIFSRVLVLEKLNDSNSSFIVGNTYSRFLIKLKRRFSSYLTYFLFREHNVHSLSVLDSKLVKYINESEFDIIHLHWVQGETLSISEIGNITKPLVWTLHDMWPFCATEHYTEITEWKSGYKYFKKEWPFFNFSALIFYYKYYKWRNSNFYLIAPSVWLKDCIQESYLFRQNEVINIPNTVDFNVFKILDKKTCRSRFNLPNDKRLILFGAVGGVSQKRKGYDLLIDSILKISDLSIDTEIVVFGGSHVDNCDIPFKIYNIGPINNDHILCMLFNSCDVFVTPSRQEVFGLVTLESLACGLPVVAFNVGGSTDLIESNSSGYLATPFDTRDFGKGIYSILSNLENFNKTDIRSSVLRKCSFSLVGSSHLNLYKQILTT